MKVRFVSTLCLAFPLVAVHFGGCGGNSGSSTFDPNNPNGDLGLTTGSGTMTGGLTGGTLTGGTLTGGSGTGSGSGGNPLDPDAACAAQAQDTRAIPVDIFIMLDKSGSMDCAAADNACERLPNGTMPTHPTRWDAVTQAITAFVNAPTSAGTGVGIGFFGLGDNVCGVNTFAMPNVAIAALPGNAMAITGAIGMQKPGGGTPTVPALQGAINYAGAYTMSTPGRTASVVFVTDGLPNGCNSSTQNATRAARNAFMGAMGAPPIKTYVVGLGATASLDEIALAGSGGTTHYFPATGDVAGQLTAALKQIAGAITCDYAIPSTGKALNFNEVNVAVKVGAGGKPTLVGGVANAMGCTAQGGWYYDNPTAPTKITLCAQSCDPLKATEGSTLQVLIGCATEGPAVN
jgi:hypothetical protein